MLNRPGLRVTCACEPTRGWYKLRTNASGRKAQSASLSAHSYRVRQPEIAKKALEPYHTSSSSSSYIGGVHASAYDFQGRSWAYVVRAHTSHQCRCAHLKNATGRRLAHVETVVDALPA